MNTEYTWGWPASLQPKKNTVPQVGRTYMVNSSRYGRIRVVVNEVTSTHAISGSRQLRLSECLFESC